MSEINLWFRSIFQDQYRITQKFDSNFKINGKWVYKDIHGGVDFGCPVGTKIYSPVSGLVEYGNNPGGFGYYIRITHFIEKDKYEFIFAHLSKRIAPNKSIVNVGDLLGETGGRKGDEGAGLSTAPHLHYQEEKNDVRIDPEQTDHSIFIKQEATEADKCWQWGIDSGLTNGEHRNDPATREEVIVILNRFAKNNNLK